MTLLNGAADDLSLPAWMYGDYKTVRANSSRRVTQLLRSGRLDFESAEDALIRPADHPGLIVLSRSWSTIDAQTKHFHPDLFWRCFVDRLVSKGQFGIRTTYSNENLERAWFLFGILGPNNFGFVARRSDSQLRIIDAAAMHWPRMDALGPRFTNGLFYGSRLSEVSTIMPLCMGRQGVDQRTLETWQGDFSGIAHATPGHRIREFARNGDLQSGIDMIDQHSIATVVLALCEHYIDAGYNKEITAYVEHRRFPESDRIVQEWLARKHDVKRVV